MYLAWVFYLTVKHGSGTNLSILLNYKVILFHEEGPQAATNVFPLIFSRDVLERIIIESLFLTMFSNCKITHPFTMA